MKNNLKIKSEEQKTSKKNLMKINTKRIFCCESYALTLGIFELCRISNIFPQQSLIFIIEEYLKECPPNFEFPMVQS